MTILHHWRYMGTKSHLMGCLQKASDNLEGQTSYPRSFKCVIYDGSVILRLISSDLACKTFDGYADVFQKYIFSTTCKRIDLVWDEYWINSLIEHTRPKKIYGTRMKVIVNAPLPKGNRRADFFIMMLGRRRRS